MSVIIETELIETSMRVTFDFPLSETNHELLMFKESKRTKGRTFNCKFCELLYAFSERRSSKFIQH